MEEKNLTTEMTNAVSSEHVKCPLLLFHQRRKIVQPVRQCTHLVKVDRLLVNLAELKAIKKSIADLYN